MEIISYVGFDNRNYSSSMENAVNRLTAFFRKHAEHLPAFKTETNILHTQYAREARHSASAAKQAGFSFHPKMILNYSAAAYNFIAKNRSTILTVAVAAFVTASAAVFAAKHIDFSPRLSSPLNLDQSSALDIEKLNAIMSSFALEETQEYTSDGTLVGEEPSVPLQTVFSQPVTFQTYKVQPGDTISGITKKFGLKNISTLIAVNDIDNVRQLCAGQKLKIPSIDGLYYTVKPGNSLTGISAKYNVTMEDLLDVNELEAAELKAGQQLFIPGAKLESSALQNALGELFKRPIAAKFRFTSMFGPRLDPFSGVKSYHTGIDMACPQGTPILASSSGTVSFAGYSNIYGNYVIIKHANGYQTLYAHMSKILAKKGQWVSQGTRIGLVGSTGYSTGPHLHFTVYKNGQLVNPMTLIK